jgi:hypothetical protein
VRRVLALLVSFALPLSAQRSPRFNIAVRPQAALVEGPAITSDQLLTDAKTREHLLNGFPARIHYQLELWSKGGGALGFDDRIGTAEWDVLVAYEPSSQRYHVLRRSSDDRVHEDFGGFQTLTSAEIPIDRPFKPALHPGKAGRYYYNLIVDVQTVSVNDLDELKQWLRGQNAPGKTNNPLAVIGSGLGTLFSRLIGGSSIRNVVVSGIFSVDERQ